MHINVNQFKAEISGKSAQIGLWLSLGSAYTTEICAGAGFDWVLIDGEHTPNDLQSILAQLQVLAGYPDTHPVARLPMGHGRIGEMLIKQYLDIGVQTLLIPMVDTAEQAAAIVRAARYPQDDGGGGIRGIAGARASRWGRIGDYAKRANQEVCLLLQAESVAALQNLDAIAATEGVDGIFIGPADLSASLGHVGNPEHPVVQAAIADAFQRVHRVGKAVGILTPQEAMARRYLEMGASFVAVGLDTSLLVQGTSILIKKFKAEASDLTQSKTY